MRSSSGGRRRSRGRGSSCISLAHDSAPFQDERSPAHKEQNRNKFVTERCNWKPSGRPIEAYPAGGRYRTRYRVGESTVVLGRSAHGYFRAFEAPPNGRPKTWKRIVCEPSGQPCWRHVTRRCVDWEYPAGSIPRLTARVDLARRCWYSAFQLLLAGDNAAEKSGHVQSKEVDWEFRKCEEL